MTRKNAGIWALAVCDLAIAFTVYLAFSDAVDSGTAFALWCAALALAGPGVLTFAVIQTRETRPAPDLRILFIASGAWIGLYSLFALYSLVQIAVSPPGVNAFTIVY